MCGDFNPALDRLKADGFRIDVIYPADEPHSALLSRAGERVRLTSRPDAPPVPRQLPPFVPEFVVTRASGGGGEGRAGMIYRDLIPSRLGGRYIASHIRIPAGGPVSDWVHYHRTAVQLIHVVSGWVRVVYEDQGEPFVLEAGDMVLQPPLIRHQVLESSDDLDVVEITAPALHETFADHAMVLPNARDAERMFGDQRFVRHVASATAWTPFRGASAQETAIDHATAGRAKVRTIVPGGGAPIDFPAHDGELVFGFVLDGTATLHGDGEHRLGRADAFVVPPRDPWSIAGPSPDFRLLHVTTALLD